MWKLYENFHIFQFQKRIVSAETIRGNTVIYETEYFKNIQYLNDIAFPVCSYLDNFYWVECT